MVSEAMKRPARRHSLFAGSFALALCVAWLGCGGAKEVDALKPRRGAIRESFTEPARTRLARSYEITMPVAGRIGRIELKPGDRVASGEKLVPFDDLPFAERLNEARAAVAELEANIRVNQDHRLERTALINMNAMVEATSETLKSSEARIDAERARSDRADKDLERKRALASKGTIAESQLEDAELEAETTLVDLRAQQFNYAALLAMAAAVNLGPRFIDQYIERKDLERAALAGQLDQARARLAIAEHEVALIDVRSPIAGEGVVLERHSEGNSFFAAGERLLTLGDFADLEAIADVLTQDALRLGPGSEVVLEPAARRDPLKGRVKRVEPAGFTKLSSLGVEQQRVNVIVEFEDVAAAVASGLGVGYRLQARFFTGSKENALVVPRFSVLQEPSGGYYVLKIGSGGALEKVPVEIGLRGDLELEIVNSKLTESDLIVATPDTTLKAGDKAKGVMAAK
jgi:HlyD family secretion protein